ncbi:MAG: PQQ-binding-like beta-propeller repeat protein [Deltaproteobacteria bacterium]|nr:PQQ-binding-like beta-propeller repeat protein [Deltaproteobacteria bacterium]
MFTVRVARVLSLPVLVCAGALLAGCAETAFSLHFPDNQARDLQNAMARLQRGRPGTPANGLGKPLAFLVGDGRLVAYDLQAQGVLWSVEAQPTSRVTVGRDYVFHRTGDSQLVGRRVADGQVQWSGAMEQGGRLLGTAADGNDLYYVVERTERRLFGGAAAHLVAVDGATGKTRWVVDSAGRLGAPAARDGLVFVPLRSQAVALLSAQDGREIARVRSKDEALLWVRTTAAGVFFGGRSGIYRLDARAVAGTRAGSTFVAAALPKMVQPPYWWDGYNAALAGYTAYDRNRLLWQVADGEGMGLTDGAVFVHNYRFFFAFDAAGATAGRLRWAYAYPRHDAVGSTFTGRTLALVTSHGAVVTLDPRSGLPITQQPVKMAVRGVTFDADGFAPAGEGKGASDLRAALKEMIWDPDRRFQAVKIFGVEQLARLPGGQVTEDLVKIVSRPDLDAAVYRRAGDVLVARRDRAAIPLYLNVLKQRTDFVEGTQAVAVDVIARALGDLKAPEAVRPLLAHLGDHETPQPALVEVVKALTALGDAAVLEPFRDFLLTYRCDAAFLKDTTALNLVAEALLRLGGEDERQLLSFVENDSHTLKPLRAYIAAAARRGVRAGKGGEARGKAGAEGKERAP